MVDRNNSCSRPNEQVCISVNRIFDSARDKDCLEDLKVQFTDAAQDVIDHATAVRTKCVDVISTSITVEDIPFNCGFYHVTVRYYFGVKLEVCVCNGRSVEVEGIAAYDKKIILFGSEKDVAVFKSDPANNDFCANPDALCCHTECSLPTVVVEVAHPISLDTKLVEKCRPFGHCCMSCDCIPESLRTRFNGCFREGVGTLAVYVSLGVFSVIRMERQVQLMIPAASLILPERDSTPAVNGSDPCSIFEKMSFPCDSFMPVSDPNNMNCCNNGCGSGCNKK